MNIYTIKFIGRKKDAIGIRYGIITTVKAETKEQAIQNLWRDYDHISSIQLVQVNEEE